MPSPSGGFDGTRLLQPAPSSYLAKTHLGHILTAVAVNLLRIGAWLAGVPRAKTRQSAFATLMAGLA